MCVVCQCVSGLEVGVCVRGVGGGGNRKRSGLDAFIN